MLDLGKRIRRPEELDEFMQKLVSSEGVFTNMADALVYAAALAFYEHLPRKAFVKTGEQIASTVFLNAGYDGFIAMLAAEAAGDYDILGTDRQDERLLIFEELANAGLQRMHTILSTDTRHPVEVIRDLTLRAFTESASHFVPDLDHLISELDA